MTQPLAKWFVLLAVCAGILLIPAPRSQAAPREHTFHIDASQYRFEPGTLRVSPGDTVTLKLRATDVVHGLYLDRYGLSVVADPGQTATLSFVADRAGSFRFRCSVPCGDIHPFMLGKLQVGPNWLLIRAVLIAVVGIAWTLTAGTPGVLVSKAVPT